MMGYNFKLERVLNYKETVENFKKAEYGDVHQKLNKEEETLYKYNRYKESLLNDREESSRKTSIANLKLYNNYIQDMAKNIEKQEQIIDETKEELEKVKEELLVAMQEKKSFEKLKENGYNEYLAESKKKEEQITDGIVTFNTNTQQ